MGVVFLPKSREEVKKRGGVDIEARGLEGGQKIGEERAISATRQNRTLANQEREKSSEGGKQKVQPEQASERRGARWSSGSRRTLGVKKKKKK